jgi:hypothetical protein
VTTTDPGGAAVTDMASRLTAAMQAFERWRETYGVRSIRWDGNGMRLVIGDAEGAAQIVTTGDYVEGEAEP